MKKRFGIFWIGAKRAVYGGDDYYVLDTLWKITNTVEEAEKEIKSMDLNEQDLVTILPVYSRGQVCKHVFEMGACVECGQLESSKTTDMGEKILRYN